MREETKQAPSAAFKKENGMWTFFVHPDGIQREAGDYSDEETAEDLSNRERLRWEENGYSYKNIIS
jgi:hypothetical protein